jgi:hypothetical protein
MDRSSAPSIAKHAEALDVDCNPSRWKCTPEIDDSAFYNLRMRMALDYGKWDPQTGDSETLARFALILPAPVARHLFRLAECLAAEALQAEREMLRDPAATALLGLPSPICALFCDAAKRHVPPTPALARVIRFDFHPTANGWRISEANADVPGGFAESSELPRLLAKHIGGMMSPYHPGDSLAKAMLDALSGIGRIALVSAPGYVEDLQVTTYLADRLRRLGADPRVVQPNKIQWDSHRAWLVTDGHKETIDGILRFYQGEWLTRRPRQPGWAKYLAEGLTPTCNPGSALLVESKRFALAWPRLRSPLSAWRSLLPECVDPRSIPTGDRDDWVLKPAYCNTGESIFAPGICRDRDWRRALWMARLRPSQWIAQRRFETLPLESPIGRVYPCLGVYAINGRAAGIYGRIAHGQVVDYRATDVAVLVQNDE